jgi:hypothetical protein
MVMMVQQVVVVVVADYLFFVDLLHFVIYLFHYNLCSLLPQVFGLPQMIAMVILHQKLVSNVVLI